MAGARPKLPGPPSAPNAFEVGSESLTLAWESPASTGGSALTGYKVLVQAGGTSGPAVRDGRGLHGRGLHGVDGGLCLPVPPPPPTTAADGVFAPLPVDEEIDLGDD